MSYTDSLMLLYGNTVDCSVHGIMYNIFFTLSSTSLFSALLWDSVVKYVDMFATRAFCWIMQSPFGMRLTMEHCCPDGLSDVSASGIRIKLEHEVGELQNELSKLTASTHDTITLLHC